MALDAHDIATRAGRPVEALTRRDIARALLASRAAQAAADLPALRRQLIAAGNPLSAPFWDAAMAIVQEVADGGASVGEIQRWLEATGTEPAAVIGMHVWDDESERSQLQADIHAQLVAHLEGMVAAGKIDPDQLAAGDDAALSDLLKLQEQWMMALQPDGRVPMWVLLDETDEQYQAEWDAAEAHALMQLRANLAELPERPAPRQELSAACSRIRVVMNHEAWPRDLLAACGGLQPAQLPRANTELWLTLAAGIVSPRDELPDDAAPDGDFDDYTELSQDEEALVALCALDLYDWLAVASAIARGGPGTRVGAAQLARFVSDYDPEQVDDQADAATRMFGHAVGLWQVIGAVDEDNRLTRLGWWGIPEAVQRAWQPRN